MSSAPTPSRRSVPSTSSRTGMDASAIMIAAMRREGVTAARARRLVALVIASLEGTVAMCRAARSVQPLEDVRQELELVLSERAAEIGRDASNVDHLGVPMSDIQRRGIW